MFLFKKKLMTYCDYVHGHEGQKSDVRVLDVSDDRHSVMVLPRKSSTSTVADDRKGNRGSSCRLRCAAIQKADMIFF